MNRLVATMAALILFASYSEEVVAQRGDSKPKPKDFGVLAMTPQLPDHADVIFARGYEFTPSGDHLILTKDIEKDRQHELFSIPFHGGESIRLNQELEDGGMVYWDSVRISPDGSFIVYAAVVNELDEDGEEREVPRELFAVFVENGVPVEGRGVVNLSPQLHESGEVINQGVMITPDNRRVVYRARVTEDGPVQLFSIGVNGENLVRLSPLFEEEGYINALGERVAPPPPPEEEDEDEPQPVTHVAGQGLYMSPDGQTLLFMANPYSIRQRTLFSVNLFEGGAREIHALPNGGFVDPYGMVVSPDGTHLVYRATMNARFQMGLFAVPIDGSSAPRPIHGSLEAGEHILGTGLQFLDEDQISYILQVDGTEREIWLTSLSGATEPRGVAVPSPGWRLSLGHTHYAPNDGILYYVEEKLPELEEGETPERTREPEIPEHEYQRRLVGLDLNGGEPPRVMTQETLRFVGHKPLDGHRASLVIADFEQKDKEVLIELFHVGFEGAREPVRLNQPLEEKCRVLSVQRVPNTDIILFFASHEKKRPEAHNLYKLDLAGYFEAEEPRLPTQVNHPLVEDGQVYEARISPDGQWIFYTADGEDLHKVELFRAPLHDEVEQPTQVASMTVERIDQ